MFVFRAAMRKHADSHQTEQPACLRMAALNGQQPPYNRNHMVPRVLTVFLTVFGAVAAAEVKVVEQIVAKVNGDIITRGELERSRQVLEAELKQQKVPEAKMQELLKERE